MSAGHIHFIINSRSCGGATGRYWKELEKLLKKEIKSYSYDFTAYEGNAIELTRQALKKRPDLLVAVGGDGTISEVINGYFVDGVLPKKAPPVGIANSGTGADLCRSLGVPSDPSLALQILKNGRNVPVDVGVVETISHQGVPLSRYFINTISFGIAGEVSQAVNRSPKQYGTFSYFFNAFKKNFSYRNKKVKISINGEEAKEVMVTMVAVCNGQFFGGGMQIAPKARLSDGYFHTVLIEDWNFLQSLWYAKNLYNGSIPFCKGVDVQLATNLSAEPSDPEEKILVDSDGETIGILPLKIRLLPQSVQFRL